MKAQGKKSINISFRLWSSLVQAKSSSGKMLGDLMEECWFARAGEDVNSFPSVATKQPSLDNSGGTASGEAAISDLRAALSEMALAVEMAEHAIRDRGTQRDGRAVDAKGGGGQGADRVHGTAKKPETIRRAKG